MNFVILLMSKLGMYILKKLNKGSSFPGYFAKRCNKNILRYFKIPKTTIFVTGSNGKTSTATTLANIYKKAGYKVGHNIKGSNLTDGIITCLIENSNLLGVVKSDILVLEIDERYVKEVFKVIEPTYFIINNLSRDQLARNGHFDIVWEDINRNISANTHLILNADDPLINKFSINHKGKTTFYGLAKTKYSKNKPEVENLDMTYCPICNTKLDFKYYHYWNIGSYSCPTGDFNRKNPKYESKLVNDEYFTIDDMKVKINNTSIHNIYNLTACYAVAKESGLEKNKIIDALNSFTLNTKRLENIKFANKECVLLISKNENAVSYNQSIDYILKQPEKKSIVIGFDNVSRRYKLDDLSWLWDVNFEALKNDNVKNIICIGKFAYDIALRLKYANIDSKKIIICTDSNEMVNILLNKSTNKFYSMFCFEIQKNLNKLLKKEGLI
ncbi:MAG TPA: DUF1727 domain-containing protein [Tenericutes bacterium]|nr:DUF1727 domain-containing protein [Mycoplasmatota bacterium]